MSPVLGRSEKLHPALAEKTFVSLRDHLVKVFVDSKKRLANDPTLLLDEADFAGQVEIGNAQWQLGFPKAETISGENLMTN